MGPFGKLGIILPLIVILQSWSITPVHSVPVLDLKNLDEIYAIPFSYRIAPVAVGEQLNPDSFTDLIPYHGEFFETKAPYPDYMYSFYSRFILSDSLADEDLAIGMGITHLPLHVYLNGVRIFKRGQFRHGNTAIIRHSSCITLPKELLRRNGQPNTLVIQGYPQCKTKNTLGYFYMGSYVNVAHHVFWINILGYHFVQATVFFAFVLFIYFLFSFYQSRFQWDFRYLYIALLSLSIFIAYQNIALAHDVANDYLKLLISRLAYPYILAFYLLFVIETTGYLNKRFIKLIIFFTAVGASFSFLIIPQTIFNIHEHLGTVLRFLILPEMMLILVLLTIASIRTHKKYYIALLFGSMIVAGTSIHDIVFAFSRMTPDVWLVPHGYVAQIITFFFVLAWEQGILHTNAIRSASRLQKLDRLKDDFLANTSHELRTPLHGIIGITNSMISGATGNLTQEQLNNLSLIQTGGRRLLRLVNDILDYSSIRNGELHLKKRAVDIRMVVDVVLKMMTPLVQHKSLNLENHIPKTIVPIYGDEDRIFQIVYNLIGNAVKYTQKGSIEVGATVERDGVCISVKDTGVGIPEALQDSIFYAFEQYQNLDYEDISGMGGVGIGLTITRELVLLHGGTIWVQSQEGKGSTFFVTLPSTTDIPEIDGSTFSENNGTYKLTEPTSVGDPTESSDISGIKQAENDPLILVIDDEHINLQIFINELTMANYRVETAFDGKSALEKIFGGMTPDIILLDIMMPGMNGFDVCKEIRKRYSYFDVPVIFISARNQPQDIRSSFYHGANDYLVKPFDPLELRVRIENQLILRDTHQKTKEMNIILEEQIEARTLELQEQTNNLIKANQDLQLFNSFVAHDLQAPLSYIHECIQVLQMNSIEESKDEKSYQTYLSQIKESTTSMLQTIGSLANLHHIDQKRLQYKQIDLSTLCRQIFEKIIRFNPIHRPQVRIHPNLTLNADPDLITVLMDNLLNNAWKFTQEKEDAYIEVNRIEHNGTPYFYVQDNGVGMEKEHARQIFNSYTRLQPDRFKGRGLGLAIVYKIIQRYEGHIWVESAPGEGSTFYFSVDGQVESKT